MPINIVVPQLGESVVEATITRWLKREGDRVAVGDILLELETEKVNLEVGSEHTGVLTQILKHEGEDVRIGDVLAVLDESAAARARAEQPVAVPYGGAAPGEPQPGSSLTTPSGPSGPIEPLAPDTPAIPDKPVVSQVAPATPNSSPALESTAMPPESGELVERVKMSRRRRTIGRNLVEAQHSAAMLTTFNEVDMTRVKDLRKRFKERFEKQHGVGLGLTSFFVKAAVAALRAFPVMNAELQGEDILYKKYYDIGVAMDTPEGLIVPVLRGADALGFAAIERAIRDFQQKSAQGALTIEDLRGGCFTITNGGIFGSLLSTPILNTPQVGILGLHRIEERPIALAGQVVIHPMMYVALSYDHRLIDGRVAVQFLARLKELIEEPSALLLEE